MFSKFFFTGDSVPSEHLGTALAALLGRRAEV